MLFHLLVWPLEGGDLEIGPESGLENLEGLPPLDARGRQRLLLQEEDCPSALFYICVSCSYTYWSGSRLP